MENDIAFKVIVKNDGISDIIFKTLMLKGEAGGTISSIEKTSSVGVVDTYTITLNDGNTSTFEVTNGSNIESIEKTATSGLIDTYTVTLTNGDTTTFEVKNGEDAQLYELPEDCIVAYDKEPELHSITGQNGYVAFDAYGIKNVKVTGYTKQATTTGKNLFNTNSLTATGITIDGNEAYGTILSFYNAYKVEAGGLPISISFEENTRYTFSLKLKYENNSQTGNGIGFRVDYSDGTYAYLISPVSFSNTDYVTLSGTTASSKTVTKISVVFVSVTSVVVYMKDIQLEKGSSATSYEPYTGGKPSPNPDYPQDIIGYGTKELDGTYTIDIEVTDNDDNVYNITASGLAYPLYAGDVLDFENSKVIRANGIYTFDGSEGWEYITSWTDDGFRLASSNFTNKVTNSKVGGDYRISLYKYVGNTFNSWNLITSQGNNVIGTTSNYAGIVIRNDSITSATTFANSLIGIDLVYSLDTPTEESVTISGDTSIVENLRGWTQVDAWDEDVTLDVWYYSDVEFPDGYEEVGLPIDDLLYYQDEEFIEFPQSWGFAIGYVFDASEIRFTINVTKDLHDGFTVVANKSADLVLNIYTGSGGNTLTGFDTVDADFIKEYGQIQIRLKTTNAHGLTVGSLLGARVSQGRLRVTFEEVQS